MRDTDDLRHALAAETADLTVHLPVEGIRRRARAVRGRRAAGVTAAAVLAGAALTVPVVLLSGGSPSGYEIAGQVPSCSASTGATPVRYQLGPFVDIGVTLDAPKTGDRYDVLLGLIGIRDMPAFVIAFRDRRTGTVEEWHTTYIGRDAGGDFLGKSEPHRFLSFQLALAANRVLDFGLYSRAADRISITSGNRSTDAKTARNAAAGLTYFWAQRTASPKTGDGPVTLTAYDADGRPEHSVTGGLYVGQGVQNPRDDQPSEGKAATTACPPNN